MAYCDICNQKTTAYDMSQLNDIYRVDGIVDLCQSCTTWANDRKSELLSGITQTLKSEILQRRMEAVGQKPVRRGFISRLIGQMTA